MTLVLYRIDDRLIHGQVVVGWGQPLDIGFIVLVDDTVAASDWEQELYRMGVPPEMDVYFHTATDAIATLVRYREDPRAGVLLTGDIATMRRLVDEGGVRTVNIGGIHSGPSRTQHLRYVFLSSDEERQLRDLAATGAEVTAQDVPGGQPVSLDDLLAGGRAVTLLDVLPVAMLGGVLGLDVVSFPQAMISRPLVAATLGGALAGNTALGLLLGAALELIALETLPFGASRYPEWGSASVVGGAIFASQPSQPAGAMTLSVLAALATTWVGGWSMVKLRQLNAVWAGKRRPALEAGARGTVISLQLMGMTADLVRGALLTAIAYTLLAPLATACIALWSMDARLSRSIVVSAAASVAGAAAWKLFHSTAGARWFFVGGLGLGLFLLFVA